MTNVMVLYGGVSPEHEVSIVSALQVMHALKESGQGVLPVYISKEGGWYLGGSEFLEPSFYKNLNNPIKKGKRVVLPADKELGFLSKGMMGFGGTVDQPDVVFPVFHGKNGEDGAIQGVLELSGLPYVGCGVTASAVGIDKYLSKMIAKSVGLNVVDDILIEESDWKKNKKDLLALAKKLGRVVFVKPNTLGSSIGIQRVSNASELENAIEVALAYDSRVLVERGLESLREVNISIMGNGPYEVSVTEQPMSTSEVLTFEDKYLRGGGKKNGGKSRGMASTQRIMPAPIGKAKIAEVEKSIKEFFGAIGGKGIARIDFMLGKDGKLYFNEINTLPGSLAFYLWEKKGIKFDKLVSRLVEMAVDDWERKEKKVTTFESNILSGFASGGMKK